MKIFRLNLLLLTISISSLTSLNAQMQLVTKPFSLGSQNIESEEFNYVKQINSSQEFISIAKSKGGKTGPCEYIIERYDDLLGTKWGTTLNIDDKEDISNWDIVGTQVVVFTTKFNTEEKKSTCFAYSYNIETGSKNWDKELETFSVSAFMKNVTKGGVRESFYDIVNSSLTKNFVPSLQYRFSFEFSPSKNYLMVYSYDYSKSDLFVNVSIFDKNFVKVKSNIVPVDAGFINYGLFINNRSDVFMLNSDHSGRVVVIRFNLDKPNENITLDYQPANNIRDHLHMRMISDDVVFVANVNEIQGKLYGVMYIKFDFSSRLLENIVFHEFSEELKEKMEAARKQNKQLRGEDDLYNYDLAELIVNESEQVTIVLEKREIRSVNYRYGELAINDISKWTERAGALSAESIVIFSFDHEGTIKWEEAQTKSQTIDLNDGLNTISYVFGDFDEKLRFVYATADNTNMFVNINIVEFDKATGYKNYEKLIANPDKISLMPKFSTWLGEDKLVLVGKKGLSGKSTFITKYKI
jgi:hypothetical protein